MLGGKKNRERERERERWRHKKQSRRVPREEKEHRSMNSSENGKKKRQLRKGREDMKSKRGDIGVEVG